MLSVTTTTEDTEIPKQSLSDKFYVLDTTSNDITVNLPDATKCEGWRIICRKYVAANSATVSAASGQYIDGSGSLAATGFGNRLEVVSNGTGWSVITTSGWA